MSTLSENELIAQIRLINTEGIGAISFYKLYHKYGSAQTALENLPPRYKAISLKEAQKEYEKAKKGGINIISFADSRYPQALKELSDCPPLLCIPGRSFLLRSIYELVQHARHNTCAKHIQDRVLFQEHRGKNNKSCQHIRSPAHAGALPERPALMHRYAHAHRIKHMQAGEHVRTRIRPVQHPHHIYKNIIPGKHCRPQILPVGKDR